MEWYWLIYDGTGSEEGGTCWHLVVLGHLVSMEQYWLIYDVTGSVEAATFRYLVVLGQ